jgi:hypothetical protein
MVELALRLYRERDIGSRAELISAVRQRLGMSNRREATRFCRTWHLTPQTVELLLLKVAQIVMLTEASRARLEERHNLKHLVHSDKRRAPGLTTGYRGEPEVAK